MRNPPNRPVHAVNDPILTVPAALPERPVTAMRITKQTDAGLRRAPDRTARQADTAAYRIGW